MSEHLYYKIFADKEELKNKNPGKGYTIMTQDLLETILIDYKKQCPFTYKNYKKETNKIIKVKKTLKYPEIITDYTFHYNGNVEIVLLKSGTLKFIDKEYIPIMREERNNMIKSGVIDYNSKYAFPKSIIFKKDFWWKTRKGLPILINKGEIFDKNSKDYFPLKDTFTESFMGNDPDMCDNIPIEILFRDVESLVKNKLVKFEK